MKLFRQFKKRIEKMRSKPPMSRVLKFAGAKIRSKAENSLDYLDDLLSQSEADYDWDYEIGKKILNNQKVKTIRERKPWNMPEECRHIAPVVIKVFADFVKDKKNKKLALEAGKVILAYAYGKPDSTINVNAAVAQLSPADIIKEVEKRRKEAGFLIDQPMITNGENSDVLNIDINKDYVVKDQQSQCVDEQG